MFLHSAPEMASRRLGAGLGGLPMRGARPEGPPRLGGGAAFGLESVPGGFRRQPAVTPASVHRQVSASVGQ